MLINVYIIPYRNRHMTRTLNQTKTRFIMTLSQTKTLKVYYAVGALGNGPQVDLSKLNTDSWVSPLV